jgi:hypothetical protein
VFRAAEGNIWLLGAIREDTAARKVFFHNFSNEILLYDFKLEPGDTIFYTTNLFYAVDYYKIVDSVNTVNVNGQIRKRWYLTNSWLDMKDIWIEGIGSVHRYGLLYPNDPDIVMDASVPNFGCFKHDTIVYIDGSTCLGTCPCTEWLVSVDENEIQENEVAIYPNPVSKALQINVVGCKNAFDYLQLYSSEGQCVLEKKIMKNENIYLNVEFLAHGLFFIKLTGKDKVIIKKFNKIN